MEALGPSENDLEALNFHSVETFAVVDATVNPNGNPLDPNPPHDIATALGVDRWDGQDVAQATPAMNIDISPNLS